MNKKKICMILAVIVTLCALFSMVAVGISLYATYRAGETLSWGLILLPLLTIFLAFNIWKGVREMD